MAQNNPKNIDGPPVRNAQSLLKINRKRIQIMSLPSFSMRQLLHAGVHFGHTPRRWNPKMKKYIFGARGGVHILDLQQTLPMFKDALKQIQDTISSGGRILFVGTKRQAVEIVADKARQCGQYYINHRWLGGTLTNWNTILNSIKRLKKIEKLLEEDTKGFTKKELLSLTREKEKMERSLGGIKDMGSVPDLIFVIDTNKETTALKEARKLGIPIVAIVDSNSDPDTVDFPIPGNDDSIRAIELYCDLVSAAVLSGLKQEMEKSGADLGASETPPVEEVLIANDTGSQEEASKETVAKEETEVATEPKKESSKKS